MKIEKFAAKMDLLGVLAFLYVIIYASIELIKEKSFMIWVLLIVGIGGFLVDLFVVIKTRLK
ncbi:MAG TPA: hypothetical protein VJH92_02765 [Candidatus Nanoarchaeia archaeon]|nr:hypothetical protein [Candidatus Nanoarchaeia archaeon]